jgi:hypothetical protein
MSWAFGGRNRALADLRSTPTSYSCHFGICELAKACF